MKRLFTAVAAALLAFAAQAQTITTERWMQPDDGQPKTFANSLNGHTYTSTDGMPITAQAVDVPYMQTNGWHIAINSNVPFVRNPSDVILNYTGIVTDGATLNFNSAVGYSGTGTGVDLPACDVRGQLLFANTMAFSTSVKASGTGRAQTLTASNQSSVGVPGGQATMFYCNGAGRWLAIVK